MKLVDEIISLALVNQRTGIVLVDNIIIDALELSRMVTPKELYDIHNYRAPTTEAELEQLYNKTA